MSRTGPTNVQLIALIHELKKTALEENVKLWKRVAEDLEKSSRHRRAVNISKIARYAKDNETVIVPGKVLGSGEIAKKVTVAAFDFSSGAVEKLKKQNCSCLSISELMQKNPKGAKVRILG